MASVAKLFQPFNQTTTFGAFHFECRAVFGTTGCSGRRFQHKGVLPGETGCFIVVSLRDGGVVRAVPRPTGILKCSALPLRGLSMGYLTIRRIGRLVIYYPHAIGFRGDYFPCSAVRHREPSHSTRSAPSQRRRAQRQRERLPRGCPDSR